MMNGQTHTSGPWMVMRNHQNRTAILAESRGSIPIAYVGGNGQGGDVEQANARLISAAPALLAACRHGLVNAEAYKARLIRQGDRGNADCVERDLVAIRAAIAAAEGKGG